MKIKKILSIVSALALCASFAATSVNAELSYDADADVLVMPTLSELSARNPQITLTAKKAESKEDVIAAGIASKQAGNFFKAEYDTYIVTMTATNIGDLAVGYTDDSYETQTGLCVPAISLYINNDAKIQKYATKTSEPVAPFVDKTSIGVQGNTLAITFGSATNVGYSYPTFDSDANGQGVTNPTITTQFVICLNAGETLDLTSKAEFTYISLVGSTGTPVIKNINVDTLTLGESAPIETTKTVDLGTISFTNGVKAEYSTGISVIIKDTVADLQGALEIALGSLELDGVTDMTVGLEVTEVPAASELVVDSYDWY